MGSKRIKHLNELRIAAAAGDTAAAAAYMAATYVPPHLRPSDRLGKLHAKTGYSGDKARRHTPSRFRPGVHLTAKTQQAVRCVMTMSMDPQYGMDRLQMLHNRRAAA